MAVDKSPVSQCWVLLLAHNYTLQYRKGMCHVTADGLSQLPVPLAQKEKQGPVEVFYASQLNTLPVSVTKIRCHTMSDVTFSHVPGMVTIGCFPAAKDVDHVLSPYLLCRQHLTIQQGSFIWGVRVVLPPKLHHFILKGLHGHTKGVHI